MAAQGYFCIRRLQDCAAIWLLQHRDAILKRQHEGLCSFVIERWNDSLMSFNGQARRKDG